MSCSFSFVFLISSSFIFFLLFSSSFFFFFFPTARESAEFSLAEFEPIHYNRTPFEDVTLDTLDYKQELRLLLDGKESPADAAQSNGDAATSGTSPQPHDELSSHSSDDANLSYIEYISQRSQPTASSMIFFFCLFLCLVVSLRGAGGCCCCT